jgi:hypothetical protein
MQAQAPRAGELPTLGRAVVSTPAQSSTALSSAEKRHTVAQVCFCLVSTCREHCAIECICVDEPLPSGLVATTWILHDV